MTNYEVFKKIINLSTITIVKDKAAYINKYNSNFETIDYAFAKLLINFEILELDSGNFETAEQHYMLNDKYIIMNSDYKLSGIDVKKIEIDLKIPIVNKSWFGWSDNFFEIQNIFLKFKKNTIRKEKLLKIKNS